MIDLNIELGVRDACESKYSNAPGVCESVGMLREFCTCVLGMHDSLQSRTNIYYTWGMIARCAHNVVHMHTP